MVEVVLEGLAQNVDEGTIQNWFFEEGDAVNEGDDLVELSTEEGSVTLTAPTSGVLAEVYYDEGEIVAKGETLCTIDDEESDEDDEKEE
jgi:pyruvate/2-oxoglutarate dehydrogenase complex dihydrolipoamide acyltransferase (E2) component